ncbi:vitamin K epoxide reductase family protein [Streptomyces mobaraensis NBRC 13819 = DSM 40847]|uniref:Vitamin K epoxide reductase n=1 Tax=Streptomyces mobaraensis (strain ATCC 29032 / DSM 40847 / JCM 4168 / NBRC 13819 / NCIMB 11159 / IPCR 16-22) TaxID=1223523 RepID=M3BBN8_STRM1|nr:vitamin K epoxide reductase family protein [Streptomyces mobaraensis]EME96949.1 vitamin K epoxide reductase [Streptomyces mobaraensis NBRC 13819 = DSM 40847]QTT72406.1 vitamin K epoxide reductase family protein [Streptomyces mobaraensis NBRC 13819 = DSM 40847]
MTDTAFDRSAGGGVRDAQNTLDAKDAHHLRGNAAGAGRALAWLLVGAGTLGLLASFQITVDKIHLAENPGFRPACSINAVVSCTHVMLSDQASVFGFPNPLIGLVAYAVVVALGVVLLTGARLPRWCWLGLNLGTLAGAVFCMWLMSQALYVIGALCLWCCLAWAVTIALFWYTTAHNLRHGFLPAPRTLVLGVREFHWAVPAAWYGVIALLVVERFWAPW